MNAVCSCSEAVLTCHELLQHPLILASAQSITSEVYHFLLDKLRRYLNNLVRCRLRRYV
jgi:hypothetical protein